MAAPRRQPVPGPPSGRVAVRLQPGASRAGVYGMREGALLVRVNAPPLEGRANKSLCRLLAKELGVPPSAVRVARGETSRDKLIEVEGIDQDELEARVRALTGAS